MRTKTINVEVLGPDGEVQDAQLTVRELTAGELRDWRNRESLYLDDLLRLAGIAADVVDRMPSSAVRGVYDLIWELSGFGPAAPAPASASASEPATAVKPGN